MPSNDERTRSAFGALLSFTTRLWRREVDRRLQPFGLTEATWLPLIRLARAPETMRQNELAASLSLDNSAVVRLLNSLEGAGLVERRPDETDRRAKAILLTPAGEEMVALVESSARRVRETAFEGIDAGDLAITARTLRHICGKLSEGAP